MGNEPTSLPETRPPEVEHLETLVKRAQQGEESALPELRQLLDCQPEIWKTNCDLATLAQEAWLNLLAGKDLLLKESVRRQLEQLQQDLAGPAPTPLESLAVQRVLVAWLQVNYADAIAAQAREGKMTLPLLRALQRGQELAGRCYDQALKQLTLVQRLTKKPGTPVLRLVRPEAGKTPTHPVDRTGT